MFFFAFLDVMVQFKMVAEKTRLAKVTIFPGFCFSLKNVLKKNTFLTIIMQNKLKLSINFFLMKIINNLLFCIISEFNISLRILEIHAFFSRVEIKLNGGVFFFSKMKIDLFCMFHFWPFFGNEAYSRWNFCFAL